MRFRWDADISETQRETKAQQGFWGIKAKMFNNIERRKIKNNKVQALVKSVNVKLDWEAK